MKKLKNNQRKSEAPWVNDEIRNEIQKRKKLTLLRQKKLIQTKIKKQMNIYTMKITNDIRQDQKKGKKDLE